MGLLDDAIREHLELKRRRGADPGEVAREQREALDPVPRERPAEVEDDRVATAESAFVGQAGDYVAVPARVPPAQDGVLEGVEAEQGGHAGETAELDMRSVLDEEQVEDGVDDSGPGRLPDAGVQAAPGPPDSVREEDSLEWEIPGEAPDADPAIEEPDEDVLEETPDFLRDTPEQDRLWFEQRPPRDFDFDK